DKRAEPLIVKDSKFWVMRPQVTLSGVSGIGTLLSGNYIGIEPGKSKAKKLKFIGLEVPPVITVDQPGREFALHADDLGSLSIGSPVYYRRLNVGQVIAYGLGKDEKSFEIKVFVNSPYDKFVQSDTRFWQESGIDLSLGANGLTVRTQSLLSVLIGGVAFEMPPDAAESEPAAANAGFKLYGDRTAAFAVKEKEIQRYVLYPQESLRGLSVGAPVSFLGLQVGEVTEVGIEFNPAAFTLRPRVEIEVYPRRFVAHLSDAATAARRPRTPEERHAFWQRLVDRGLRAQLQSQNILTGQLFIAFEYFPDAPKARIDWAKQPPVVPVMPGGLESIQDKLTNILTKVEQLPLDDIGGNMKKVLESLDRTLEDVNKMVARVDGEVVPDVKKTLGTLDQTLQDADKMLVRVDGEVVPEVKKTLEDLQKSVASAQRVLANTDAALLGPDAPAQQDLRDALQEIARAAREMRVLADYLERHPETLIRGKAQEKP
ncbi:MAG TPA: MlaD family protein, partial [Candidatus Methylomirabilis sp.]|nr:MlaD family protein [Candidatus Methylomirabilis sp.]